MLWETSIYKFRVPVDTTEQEEEYLKEIALDVTLSAPPFLEPKKTLEEVFSSLFEYLGWKKPSKKILDFGAAKLRNTIYLLEKGYTVRAVEFEKLLNAPGQSSAMHEKAKQYNKRFGELVFPHAFVNSSENFDLVLLINVLGTMPVPAERLLVIQHCYQKLKKGGCLFYYSMHGDAYYREKCTDEVRIGDGYYMNKGKHKSFFREFDEDEVDFMFMSNGFDWETTFFVKNNYARLYRKTNSILLDGCIPVHEIEAIYEHGKSISDPKSVEPAVIKKESSVPVIVPNPEEFELDSLWINKLRHIPLGDTGQTEFHRLAALIIRRVFRLELRNFVNEENINQGRKRVDIVASNRSKEGFFCELKDTHKIHCPYIFMECKNYEKKIKNPEIDQLAGRLNPSKGQFGLLLYRDASNSNKAVIQKSCQDFLDDKKYILALDENDLISLLKLRQQNADEDITNFLDNRFRALILKQG